MYGEAGLRGVDVQIYNDPGVCECHFLMCQAGKNVAKAVLPAIKSWWFEEKPEYPLWAVQSRVDRKLLLYGRDDRLND